MELFRLTEIRQKLKDGDIRKVSYETGLSHMTLYNVINKKRTNLKTLSVLLAYFWPKEFEHLAEEV
jgi:lambda repressor-like predicted transcriptional regulator